MIDDCWVSELNNELACMSLSAVEQACPDPVAIGELWLASPEEPPRQGVLRRFERFRESWLRRAHQEVDAAF